MVFAKDALIYALVTAAAFAAPSPAPVSLVVVDTQETPFGTLYFYGEAGGSNRSAAVAARREECDCGSNDVTCDTSNVPTLNSCINLISGLKYYGGTFVGGSYRALCLTSDSQCCASWSNAVPNLYEHSLVNAANDVCGGCVQYGRSGLARNVNLDGTCTIQCLSNRPDGCYA